MRAGLALGVRQCGAGVDRVALPAWAADARLFVLAHRQALEAPAVSERLPLWIDLVFGYKQTGQAAIDAINVFPACVSSIILSNDILVFLSTRTRLWQLNDVLQVYEFKLVHVGARVLTKI